MKEHEKTRALIGFFAMLILAFVSHGKIVPWIWMGLAVIWAIKFVYLSLKY